MVRQRDLDDSLRRARIGIMQERRLRMDTDQPTPDLNAAMLDVIAMFERLGIRYALVGGIAAMYYGRARFTDDLDFAVEFMYDATLSRNTEVMRDFHFDPSWTYKLYHDSGIEMDLLRDEFVDDVLDRAVEAKLAGRPVRIADANDLAAMKLRAARPQDDYDISQMIAARALDEQVIRTRVTGEQFARFLEIKSRTPL